MASFPCGQSGYSRTFSRTSDLQMPELVDVDDSFDMNSPNHPSSPYSDVPVSADPNIPPLSPQAPKVPPKITRIFHPTINGMLSFINIPG